MHVKLTMQAVPKGEEIVLPMHYNSTVQGFIYSVFDTIMAEALHDHGYMVGKRQFKLFVYSRLDGYYELNKKKGTICFPQGCSLVLASPIFTLVQSIINGVLENEHFKLGRNTVQITKTEVYHEKVVETTLKVRTLSPIVVYSTLVRPDGRKYTCYFHPKEPNYNQLITNNLIKKHQACYNKSIEGVVTLKPLNEMRLNVVKYKNFIIKGYSGLCELTGPQPLLQLALDAGIGSKNSQGFGCLKRI